MNFKNPESFKLKWDIILNKNHYASSQSVRKYEDGAGDIFMEYCCGE